MKKMLIFLLLGKLALILHASSQLENQSRREIERALEKTGKVIICSPYGRVPGTLSFEEAAKKLRSGMVLRMLPGHYNPMELIIFRQDKIIIEGDGSGGYVYAPLILYGKECIVRNIRAYTLEVEDATVINTFTHYITVTNGSKRGRCLFYNCAANYLRLYTNAHDITFIRCTFLCGEEIKDSGKIYQTATYTTHKAYVYSSINLGRMNKKGELAFDSCILYTNGNLFSHGSEFLELRLTNNIIHCERSLKRTSKDKPEIRTISGLKDFFEMDRANRNNKLGTPNLKKKAPNNWSLSPDYFILTPKSLGYGNDIGVNMGTKMPVTPWKNQKK